MSRRILTFLFVIQGFLAHAQHYVTKQYRVENGLPTDLIKSISQDREGNLWIASDEGFIRYDGVRFQGFPLATHSNYTKGFLKMSDGRLLAYGDLDVVEIVNVADSATFRQVLPVTRSVSDSSVSYPKLLFEDHDGALWISESQSVVRLKEGKQKRYEFTLADRTPQFLRSFSFFEDLKKNLYAVSFAGNVFRFDEHLDAFVNVPNKFPAEVEFAGVLKDALVIGAGDGLYVAKPAAEGGFGIPELVSSIPKVSCVVALPNGNYFVSTRGSSHYIVDSSFSNPEAALKNISNVNQIYLSGEHDIWLSTNEGIVLMQNAPFLGPLGNTDQFVECIAEDGTTPLIYYASSLELHSFDLKTRRDVTLLAIKEGYFQSMLSAPDGVWAANSFQVILIKENKIVKTFDFSDQRMFITRLSPDHDNNIWLTIPGRRDIIMIDRHRKLHSFGIPLGESGFVNDVREGEGGIYAASSGSSSYLFFKSYADSSFRNISLPIKGLKSIEVNAFQLTVKGRNVWLATSAGLVKYDHQSAQAIFPGDVDSDYAIRAVCDAGKSELVIATSHELMLYNTETGDYNLFASSRHLSGINSRSILVTREKRLLVGTSKGFYSSSGRIDEKSKTLRPMVVFVTENGKRIPSHLQTVPYHTLLSLTASSVSFPEDENVYDFRLSTKSPWRHAEGSVVNIITSSSGAQTIQLRARKTGAYDWSDITSVNFFVASPYWQNSWFYLSILVLVILIIGLTILVVRRRHIVQHIDLETKVAERTTQLEALNSELEAFSYSVSHDLRAPLRSIMAYAEILEEDNHQVIDEKGLKNLASIRRNAIKMNQLINDLLRLSKILHQGLHFTVVDTNRIVNEVIIGLKESPGTSAQFNVTTLPSVVADEALITQVWLNLIGNAVKYSSRVQSPVITITAEETKKEIIFCIRDNGAGFDMQYADKLFGVFQRLHSNREFEGTGIGLALVRRIITRHNGRLWATGKVDEGAEFFFALPRTSIPVRSNKN